LTATTWPLREYQSILTGGWCAAAVLQRKAIAMVKVVRVIAQEQPCGRYVFTFECAA
jgi:hypothetical protein